MSLNKIIVFCLVALCSSDEDNFREVFDIPEGSNCTWNGLGGKCITILNCRSAKDGLRRKVYPPFFLFAMGQLLTLVYVRDDKDKVNDGTSLPRGGLFTLTLKRLGLTPRTDIQVDSRFNQTGSKAREYCLKYLENLPYPCRSTSRVKFEKRRLPEKNCYDYMEPSALGDPGRKNTIDNRLGYVPENYSQQLSPEPPISAGFDAKRNQYPHMALLGYGYYIEIAQWLCGGSVISKQYILTAAHCISSPTVGPVKFIALGILKRSDPPKLWQTHNVKRIIAHPEYQPPSKYNDIALLETENTITFSYQVLPACLPLVQEPDDTAEATGWGALGHHQELADTLQTVKLHRYDTERCSQLYPKHRHLREGYNHTSQMCDGDTQKAKDTCEGDSGGPLQTPHVFLSCAYTVLGVTSYGRQCGISAGSGMYTRVYHYVPWIESVVWP